MVGDWQQTGLDSGLISSAMSYLREVTFATMTQRLLNLLVGNHISVTKIIEGGLVDWIEVVVVERRF